MDVEADEVDIGKALAEDAGGETNSLMWEQWCRIVERGRLSSLKLIRLNPRHTRLRAPGPGPIRRRNGKRLVIHFSGIGMWCCTRMGRGHTN